ncbi:MAG: UDP-N-acetylmuramate--L-alanine ligase [Candidatus Dormibacterales bacterium]
MKVHLVGIGGAGVSALALGFVARGDEVSGCDWKESESTLWLASEGIRVVIGHDAAHVAGLDLLVYTGIVTAGMAEVEAARARGVRVLTRPQALAEMLQSPRSIAVAGSHGKTTVTAMVGHILVEAGWDPTVMVADGVGSRAGAGGWLVAEADESDGSLVAHRPRHALITNVEHDHPDRFPRLEDVTECFRLFLAGLAPEALAVVCADDPRLPDLPTAARRVTYGFAAADYSCGRQRPFPLRRGATLLGAVDLALPGWHNVQDACGAAAMTLELGVGFETVAAALAGFKGAHRRLERLGCWRGAEVYDDYGHHPSEITATIAAARELTGGRLVLVFQPHRYTRYTVFRDAFAAALRGADRVIVTEIYAAGEANPGGLTARGLADIAGAGFASGPGEARALLEASVSPGDLVLCMGAGDIWRLGRELAREG